MPTITDWIMVGITAAYVIATGFICWFNGKSARASRAQLEESKRQFEEKKRLDVMPLFSIEFTPRAEEDTGSLWIPHRCYVGVYQAPNTNKQSFVHCGYYMLLLNNVGLGPAKSINMIVENHIRRFNDTPFFIGAVASKGSYEMYIEFQGILGEEKIDTTDAKLVFEYLDVLNNAYRQTVELTFSIGDRELFLVRNQALDVERL